MTPVTAGRRSDGVSVIVLLCLVWLGVGDGRADTCEGYSLVLTEPGPHKVEMIKAVREITGLGLRDSNDLVKAAPSVIASGLPREAAEWHRDRIEQAGGIALV